MRIPCHLEFINKFGFYYEIKLRSSAMRRHETRRHMTENQLTQILTQCLNTTRCNVITRLYQMKLRGFTGFQLKESIRFTSVQPEMVLLPLTRPASKVYVVSSLGNKCDE